MSIYLLHIETSGDICSVSLSLDGVVVSEQSAVKDRSHSEILTLMIQDVLNEAQISRSQLSGVVLGIGPGSYTGLRVGSAVAKGLCYSLDIPLITFNTLTAMAAGYRDNSSKTIMIPMIIARKEEVYLQVLDGKMEVLHPVHPTIIDDTLIENFNLNHYDRVVICGNATHLVQPYIRIDNVEYYDKSPDAHDLTALSYQYFIDENFTDIAYFDLDYIKSPHITKSKKQALSHRNVKK